MSHSKPNALFPWALVALLAISSTVYIATTHKQATADLEKECKARASAETATRQKEEEIRRLKESQGKAIQIAREDLRRERAEHRKTSDELDHAKRAHEKALTELSSTQEKLAKTSRDLTARSEALSAAQKEQAATVKALEDAKGDLAARSAALAHAEEQLASLEKALAAAQEELATTKKALEDARKKQAATQTALASRTRDLSGAQNRIAELEDATRASANALVKARDALAEKQSRLDLLEKKRAELALAKTDLEHRGSALEASIHETRTELEQSRAAHRATLAELRETVADLRGRLRDLTLLARAASLVPSDPELALLLALESTPDTSPLLASNTLVAALQGIGAVRELSSSEDVARHAGFERAPRRSATLAETGQIHISDPTRPDAKITIESGTEPFRSLSMGPDGRYLLALLASGQARVFDAASGQLVATSKAPTTAVKCTAWHSGGERVALGLADGSALLWSFSSAGGSVLLEARSAPIEAILFDASKTGRVLTLAGDGSIRLWSLEGGAPLATLRPEGDRFEVGAFHPSEAVAALGTAAGTIHLISSVDGAVLATWKAPAGPITALAFDPRGEILASADAGGTAHLWATGDGRELVALPGDGEALRALRFSHDGRWILCSAAHEGGCIWPVDARGYAAEVKPRELTPAERSRFGL